MKTDTSVDDAFLGSGVCAIQPSGCMRVALVSRHARGGHPGTCSAVKAVPPCNQSPVTFDRANLWRQHATVGFVVQSVRAAFRTYKHLMQQNRWIEQRQSSVNKKRESGLKRLTSHRLFVVHSRGKRPPCWRLRRHALDKTNKGNLHFYDVSVSLVGLVPSKWLTAKSLFATPLLVAPVFSFAHVFVTIAVVVFALNQPN